MSRSRLDLSDLILSLWIGLGGTFLAGLADVMKWIGCGCLALIELMALGSGQTLASSSCPVATSGNTLTVVDDSADPIPMTGIATDVAVHGDGWFVLRDRANSRLYYTRLGDFRLDADGFLVTCQDLPVQGYCDADLRTVGDLCILPAGATGVDKLNNLIRAYNIAGDGRIWVSLADGRVLVAGQILLQSFGQPENLVRVGYKTYEATPWAVPSHRMGVPASAGLGAILHGRLEWVPDPVLVSCRPMSEQVGPARKGVLTRTGVVSDLGIVGEGFFLVRDPTTSELLATRAGMFLRDGDGYLMTYDGLRLQGFTDPTLSATGDVCIDGNGAPSAPYLARSTPSYALSTDGRVTVMLADGTPFVRAQVSLFSFTQPGLLVRSTYDRYRNVVAAGPRRLHLQGGVYAEGIRQGTLELANIREDLIALRNTLSTFPLGAPSETGQATDLAIVGPGFFMVKDPRDGRCYATRRGAFLKDEQGYLVNSRGMRLQGYCDRTLLQSGDLRVAARPELIGPAPKCRGVEFKIEINGELAIQLPDGRWFFQGQIFLQNFSESFRLRPAGDGLYTNLTEAKPLGPSVPGSNAGVGAVRSGALEMPSQAVELKPPPEHGFRLSLSGEPGMIWTVQRSINLIDWTEWMVLGSSEQLEIAYPKSNSDFVPCRFYRVFQTAVGAKHN